MMITNAKKKQTCEWNRKLSDEVLKERFITRIMIIANIITIIIIIANMYFGA